MSNITATGLLSAAGTLGDQVEHLFDQFGPAFGIFSAALVAVGAFWLLYATASGVMQTAHEGEFLGKRLSSTWLPVRILVAVMLLVPVLNGWNLAQKAQLMAAKGGIGGGNMISAAMQPVLVAPKPVNVPPEVSRLTQDVLYRQACGAAVAFGAAEMQAAGVPTSNSTPTNVQCGAVTVPKSDLASAHASAINRMVQSLSPLATRLSDRNGPAPDKTEVLQALDEAARQYQSDISAAARRIPAAALPADPSWTDFGFRYVRFGAQQSKVSGAINQVAQVGAPQSDMLFDVRAPWDAARVRIAEALGTRRTLSNDPFALAPAPEQPQSEADNQGTFSKLFGSALGLIAFSLDDVPDDPIVAAQGIGSALLGIASAGLAAASALSIVPLVGNAAPIVANLILPPLFLLGFILLAYIPMIPAIHWISAIINWLVTVAEAIIAAPLWAFAHFELEGEGMGSRASYGYLFLLNLLARPALIVMGFGFATLALLFVGHLVNGFFIDLLRHQTITSFGALVQAMAWYGTFAITLVGLVGKVFSIAQALPDAAIAWIGQRVGQSYGHDEHTGHLYAQGNRVNVRAANLSKPRGGNGGGGSVEPAETK